MPELQPSDAIVAVVDDDLSVREGLSSLIRSVELRVETFASAQEFLARSGAEPPSCLVLDLQLPGLSGLDLQKRMAEGELRDRRNRHQHGLVCELRNRYQSLTAREQEVMQHVISGRLNKQIAAELQITEFTVKIHRGHVMQKMRADSLADLVRMAETLGIRPEEHSPGEGVPKSCRPGAVWPDIRLAGTAGDPTAIVCTPQFVSCRRSGIALSCNSHFPLSLI